MGANCSFIAGSRRTTCAATHVIRPWKTENLPSLVNFFQSRPKWEWKPPYWLSTERGNQTSSTSVCRALLTSDSSFRYSARVGVGCFSCVFHCCASARQGHARLNNVSATYFIRLSAPPRANPTTTNIGDELEGWSHSCFGNSQLQFSRYFSSD